MYCMYRRGQNEEYMHTNPVTYLVSCTECTYIYLCMCCTGKGTTAQ